ncbi:MAG: hypothetical protein ABSE96_22200 [Terracidiphilus sp.]|jgi:hypothetical protein
MEKQNENVRDRLLARMPQPENLAAYREETASLLAKHKRALFWEGIPATVLSLVAVGLFWMTFTPWAQRLGTREVQILDACACLFFFAGAMIELRYKIYQNRVELLKEVKQVQLQILELQASLGKASPPQT